MPAERTDILLNSGLFDADWYTRTHHVAPDLGLTAEAHFLSIGRRLDHGLSAQCPRLSDQPRLKRALTRQPDVSYCIPVLNRADDLLASLAENLAANRPHQDSIEFVVMELGGDDVLARWIQANFAEDLASGYLRLIRSERMDSWHFGKAKNAFRRYMAGRVYSSLDADNFVTAEETEQLLGVIARFGPMFLFHHFAGTWGDGTSGRISLSAALYRRIGYDERFLPRQFDEVDLILSTLHAVPDLPLLQYDTPEQVLGSVNIRNLLSHCGLSPRRVCLPMPPRRAAQNAKPADYVTRDPMILAMQNHNEAACYVKTLPDGPTRQAWLERWRGYARDYVAGQDLPTLLQVVFGISDPQLPTDGPVGLLTLTPDTPDLPADLPRMLSRSNLAAICVIDGRGRAGTPLPATEKMVVFQPRIGHPLTAADLWEGTLQRALGGESRSLTAWPAL